MSHSDWWLATNTTGPRRGTCSAPVTDRRSIPLNSGPATGRTVRQKRSPGSGVAGATGSSATIRATTSCTLSSLLSITTASGAGASCSESSWSRWTIDRSTSSTGRPSSAARRAARTPADATR